jgi:drug efflux transport system permease protein
MRRRIAGIIRKEFIHIVRDVRTLMIIILMPIMMIVLYGYAITLDISNISFGVIDNAMTPDSRALIQKFSENRFFILEDGAMSNDDVEPAFFRRDVGMVLVIAEDFSETLATSRITDVQLLIDASDSNLGTYIKNYSNQVLNSFNAERNTRLPIAFRVEPIILYNPAMKSSHFFVPGLVALILMLISALLTSITISREKETGTMEQILVSPVRPIEILIGKVVPYIFLGLINAAMILVSSKILFGVPIRGSIFLLFGLTLIFIFTALAFGLMISTVAKTQQVAMLMTIMATILPTIMLSGFIFPIPSMPLPLQYLSQVFPATHYLVIIRGVLLKGVGISDLLRPTLILSGIGLVILVNATVRFNTRLEK